MEIKHVKASEFNNEVLKADKVGSCGFLGRLVRTM